MDLAVPVKKSTAPGPSRMNSLLAQAAHDDDQRDEEDDGDDYDVILDDVIENDDVTDGDDDDEDDVYGRVVFTPFGQEETSRRKRSVPPAAIPSRFHFIFFQRRME